MVFLALLFGIRIESGVPGFLVLILLVSLWAMVFSGFMQLISLRTRSAAATQGASMVFFPLLFLTPNFVPRDQLTRPMEIAATFNPVTYIMEAARSLILVGFDGESLAKGFGVVAVAMGLMLFLSVRMVNDYD
jgi:ABC-2 type transport system permease protein